MIWFDVFFAKKDAKSKLANIDTVCQTKPLKTYGSLNKILT